ncbi:Autophagy-related protein 13 [Geodia barretti]|nr:Autophagy-related protein 13 [Geodia barretti]
MASQERREFDKYLKFLTFKAVQVIVQSRQGGKIATRSNPHGNDWFNLSILDDKQVTVELKRSLEGRLPEAGQPVCVEILMETSEGDSIVLEVWSIELDPSRRDVSVSVAHVLYPRLSLMLRSLVVLSRTTPAYRLSRSHEDTLKFT